MKRTHLPPRAQRCPRCNERKGAKHAFCAACEELQADYPNIFRESGYRVCPRCLELGKSKREATFWSQHCRKVTRCEACRAWMSKVEESLGLYGHRYDVLEKQVGGSFDGVRHHLQQHVGGRMTALKQKAIYANEHAKAIVGVPFRRLTPEEIEREYPPERIAAILERAQPNWETNRAVPQLVQR
jgi:hypothetical protein